MVIYASNSTIVCAYSQDVFLAQPLPLIGHDLITWKIMIRSFSPWDIILFKETDDRDVAG